MKSNRIRYLAWALAGGAIIGSTTYADKVSLEQLPVQLKDKIQAQTGSARIEDIDRQTKGGQTTYEVAFKRNGQNTEYLFNEKGELLRPSPDRTPASGKISYNELPDVVKRIADTRTKGGEVNDVDRQVKNGQTTYEIGFKENGQQQELLIAQDGRILNDVPVTAAAAGTAASSATGTESSTTRVTLAEPVQLSAASKVDLGQTPAAVQKTLEIASDGARVQDIDRGTWNGQTVYQAAFKENGRNVELQVREDGTILHDPRRTGLQPGTGGIHWGNSARRNTQSALYKEVTSPVTLSSAQKVDQSALPVTVQRRLPQYIGGQAIQDIDRGTWQGKTVYEVAFKDVNGQHVELQVDDKGNVIYDPRAQH